LSLKDPVPCLERKRQPGGGLARASEESIVGEGNILAVADYDVIEDPDAEQISGLFETLGDR
jgi:hypothetical protein